MLISLHYGSVFQQQIIDLNDDNNPASAIRVEDFEIILDKNLVLNARTLCFSGVLLIDYTLKGEAIRPVHFNIDGEHYFFRLCSEIGNESVKGKLKSAIVSEVIQEFSTEKQWPVPTVEDKATRQVLLLVSKIFMDGFITDEPWESHAFLAKKSHSYAHEICLRPLLEELWKTENEKLYRRAYFELNLKTFFSELQQQSEGILAEYNIQLNDKKRLLAAKDLLTAEFAKPPTIPELARRVNLNEFKLKKFYKEVFGKSVHNFVIELRMARAEQLLLKAFSVEEISEKVGYKSVSHFISVFKLHFGKTPKQLLKKNSV